MMFVIAVVLLLIFCELEVSSQVASDWGNSFRSQDGKLVPQCVKILENGESLLLFNPLYLVKLGSDGLVIWEKTFLFQSLSPKDEEYMESYFDILDDGFILLSGMVNQNVGTEEEQVIQFVMKLNSENGEMEWKKVYGPYPNLCLWRFSSPRATSFRLQLLSHSDSSSFITFVNLGRRVPGKSTIICEPSTLSLSPSSSSQSFNRNSGNDYDCMTLQDYTNMGFMITKFDSSTGSPIWSKRVTTQYGSPMGKGGDIYIESVFDEPTGEVLQLYGLVRDTKCTVPKYGNKDGDNDIVDSCVNIFKIVLETHSGDTFQHQITAYHVYTSEFVGRKKSDEKDKDFTHYRVQWLNMNHRFGFTRYQPDGSIYGFLGPLVFSISEETGEVNWCDEVKDTRSDDQNPVSWMHIKSGNPNFELILFGDNLGNLEMENDMPSYLHQQGTENDQTKIFISPRTKVNNNDFLFVKIRNKDIHFEGNVEDNWERHIFGNIFSVHGDSSIYHTKHTDDPLKNLGPLMSQEFDILESPSNTVEVQIMMASNYMEQEEFRSFEDGMDLKKAVVLNSVFFDEKSSHNLCDSERIAGGITVENRCVLYGPYNRFNSPAYDDFVKTIIIKDIFSEFYEEESTGFIEVISSRSGTSVVMERVCGLEEEEGEEEEYKSISEDKEEIDFLFGFSLLEIILIGVVCVLVFGCLLMVIVFLVLILKKKKKRKKRKTVIRSDTSDDTSSTDDTSSSSSGYYSSLDDSSSSKSSSVE